MATLIKDFGLRRYGTNPTFTLTFYLDGALADIDTTPTVKVTDGNGVAATIASLTHAGLGTWTFKILGGLMSGGTWTGHGFIPTLDPEQTSIDFVLTVEPTANP